MKDNYKPSNDTYTVLMILGVCVAVILLLLCGCGTTHEVERVEVHDTLHIHHSDTVRDLKVLTVHDTTRQVEKHTYTINNVGDTIKEIHHYHNSERTVVVDSTDRYQAKVDSLQAIIDRQKETLIEKRPSWWDRWKWRMAAYAALCGLVIVLWRSYKDKILSWLRRKI